jgi:hypothetical protein
VPGNCWPVLFDNVKVGRNILVKKPTYFKKWHRQIFIKTTKPFTTKGCTIFSCDAQANFGQEHL